MRKVRIFALVFLLLLLAGCGAAPDHQEKQPSSLPPTKDLQVHFIDVGQADAILVQNGESALLVDAGNNDDGQLVVNYLKQRGISKLDVVLGTHPHEDHIGGLDNVLLSLPVDKVYLPKVSHTTETYGDVLRALQKKGLKATGASGGQQFQLGQAKVELLAPNSPKYEELNNYSIVCKITYGETSFLLTGDAEELSEEEMLNEGYNLRADVLKVGHHGSHSSTSEKFLQAVKPQFAVISVGQGNDYGHPHREILHRLAKASLKVYRTDQGGTLVMTSDGKAIQVQTEKELPISAPAPVSQEQYVDSQGKGLIKGNINKKGDKIYHLPDQANYEQTQPEVWFKTEAEAQAAGFRRAGR